MVSGDFGGLEAESEVFGFIVNSPEHGRGVIDVGK